MEPSHPQEGNYSKSVISRLPHPPKNEICPTQCLQHHHIISKLKLLKISYFSQSENCQKSSLKDHKMLQK